MLHIKHQAALKNKHKTKKRKKQQLEKHLVSVVAILLPTTQQCDRLLQGCLTN